MSTRAKGRNAEKEVKKLIESWGYSVELTPMPQKFKTSQDFFSTFDLFAVRKPRTKSEYKDVLLVQVKSNSTAGALKKVKEWKLDHKTDHIDCLVIVRYDNKPSQERFKIYNV